MGRYRAKVEVPVGVERAFALWTDAGRYPQWQAGVLRAFDASGPVDEAGTVFRLDYGPGMKRTVTVLKSDRPRRYRIREEGLRSTNETQIDFEAIGSDRTRIVLTYDLRVGLGPVSAILERLTRGTTERQVHKELERFAVVASRPEPEIVVGALCTVDCGAGFRVIKVIAVDHDAIHLAVMPGAAPKRPADPTAFIDAESVLDDPLAFRPLQPSVRRMAKLAITGQPFLALDGGVGIPHFALTRAAFADALPEHVGALAVFPEELAEVVSWRSAGGPLFGRDLDVSLAPLVSVLVDGRYGIAKILRTELRAVHIRLYSDRWDMPPDHLDPWLLRMDQYTATMPGVGHMPLSRAAFAAMQPRFHRLATLTTSELEGYEMWREAKGGVFT